MRRHEETELVWPGMRHASSADDLSPAGLAGDHPELGEPWQPLKLYYTHWPEQNWERAKEMFLERGMKWPFDREEEKPDEDPEHVSEEEAREEKRRSLADLTWIKGERSNNNKGYPQDFAAIHKNVLRVQRLSLG